MLQKVSLCRVNLYVHIQTGFDDHRLERKTNELTPGIAERLCKLHRTRQAQATVALFASPEPWTGGVVETDSNGRVLRFVEKPDRKQISTNLISAGIFVLEPQVLDVIPAGQFYDFGRDVFPKLLAERRPVYAMEPKAYIQDVGTPERLAKAQRDFEEGALK